MEGERVKEVIEEIDGRGKGEREDGKFIIIIGCRSEFLRD